MVWLVARSVVGAEFQTREKLQDIGVTAYLPIRTKWIRPRHVRKRKLSTLPLFPAYMFVLSEDIGETRMRIRGRALRVGILSAGPGHGPLIIGYSDINEMMRREDAGEFRELDLTKPREFRIGELVIVVQDHAFGGHRGAIIAKPAHQGRRAGERGGHVVTTETIVATHHDTGRCLASYGVLTAVRVKYVSQAIPYRIVCFTDHLHSTFPWRTLVQFEAEIAGPAWEGRQA
jgi:hypothetical protein